jgi:hypothetical protein
LFWYCLYPLLSLPVLPPLYSPQTVPRLEFCFIASWFCIWENMSPCPSEPGLLHLTY